MRGLGLDLNFLDNLLEQLQASDGQEDARRTTPIPKNDMGEQKQSGSGSPLVLPCQYHFVKYL